MSKEELDSLFKNKLQDHKREPSGDAWNRLEQQLPGSEPKGTVFRWWHAAAAVLLLATAGYLFLKPDTPSQIAETIPAVEENSMDNYSENQERPAEGKAVTEGSKETPAAESPVQENATKEPASSAPAANERFAMNEQENEEKKSGQDQEPKVVLQKKDINVIAETAREEPVIETSEIKEVIALNTPEESAESENTALRISIEEFDEALLPETNQVDTSKTGTEKKKGIKKLWAAVKNAPANLEDGFGELRAAKNDLLSLSKEETEKP